MTASVDHAFVCNRVPFAILRDAGRRGCGWGAVTAADYLHAWPHAFVIPCSPVQGRAAVAGVLRLLLGALPTEQQDTFANYCRQVTEGVWRKVSGNEG